VCKGVSDLKKLLGAFIVLALVFSSGEGQEIRKWDSNLQPTISRQFYPANSFHAYPDTGAAVASGAAMTSQSGTPAFAEIGSLGIEGLRMTTADEIGTLIAFPFDLDKNYNIAWRVWWTSTSADDDGSIVWIVSTQEIAQNSAIPTVTTAGLADDVTMDADSTETQHGLEVTTWDTLSQAALSTYSLETLIALGVELDADGDASADEIHFLGVEMAYVSKIWRAQDDSLYIPGSKVHGVNQGLFLKR